MESTIEITFQDAPGGATRMTIFYPDITGIEGDMLKNMRLGWEQSVDKMA